MISSSYNIKEFVNEVKDKNRVEIIQLAQKEAYGAEKSSAGVMGAKKARNQGSFDYSRILKGLIFFLNNEKKPDRIYDREFQRFRPIAENLVQKNQLGFSILELFG